MRETERVYLINDIFSSKIEFIFLCIKMDKEFPEPKYKSGRDLREKLPSEIMDDDELDKLKKKNKSVIPPYDDRTSSSINVVIGSD